MATTQPFSYKLAFLGTGVIAGTHLAAIQQIPGLQLAGVCDLDRKKADAFREESGASKAYYDLDSMLADCSPDVVHILLPPTAHAATAQRCLQAGSHIFIEKPFAVTVEECRSVEQAALRAGRRIGVNHNLTFMPSMVTLLEHLRSGRLGAVEHVAVHYTLPMPGVATGPTAAWMFSKPGLMMLELGPHPLSIVCRLLGHVVEAKATASHPVILANGVEFHRRWNAALRCDRGTANLLLSADAGNYAAFVHVFGEDGEALVDLRRNTCVISEKTPYLRFKDYYDVSTQARFLLSQARSNLKQWGKGILRMGPPFLLQNLSVQNSLLDFYTSLQQNRNSAIDADQGAAVVDACHKVIQSSFSSHEGLIHA